MKAATIGLCVLYAVLQFMLVLVVQPNYPPDASTRFIERSTTIPSMKEATADHGDLNRDNLTAWIASPENEIQRKGYVSPILFPLDLLYLLVLGCLLGSLSELIAKRVTSVSNWPTWRWWLLPAAYMVCDLTEDSIILLTLSKTVSLTSVVFVLLRLATIAKLITVTLAIIQTALLAVLWIVTRLGRLHRTTP